MSKAETFMSIFSHVSAPAPRYLLRLAILERLLKRYIRGSDKCFLEIGPGRGDVSIFLSRSPVIAKGLVIDRSEKAVEIVRARMRERPEVEVVRGDIRDIAAEMFDYVLSFEVLEHIEEDEAFMRDVYRRIAPGGYWFISVPAYMRKWQRQDEYSGHVRRYEADELVGKLSRSGFEVIELIDYGFPLTTLMRPFRDRFYQQDTARSDLEKTLDSGTEQRVFVDRSPWPLLVLLAPFIVMQRAFSWLRQGDGFIAVAKKPGDMQKHA